MINNHIPDPSGVDAQVQRGTAWIAPLTTVVALEIADFTKPSGFPGTDQPTPTTAS